jgi:hypothetical protein
MFDSFSEYERNLEEVNEGSKPDPEYCANCGSEIDDYNKKIGERICQNCEND